MPNSSNKENTPSGISKPYFLEIALRDTQLSSRANADTFKAMFGLCPTMTHLLWAMIHQNRDDLRYGLEEKHLLWALHFLKQYAKLKPSKDFCDTSVNTYLKWMPYVLELITSIDNVSAPFPLILGGLFIY